MITFRPPAQPSGKPQATLSIRARLLLLALIAVVPLMIDRARSIETDRAERIAALSEEALALTRQGIEAQQEIVVAARSVGQVVARAHATLGTSQENCGRFLAGATSDAPWITGLSIVGANGRGRLLDGRQQHRVRPFGPALLQEAQRSEDLRGGRSGGRTPRGVRPVAAMPALEEDAGRQRHRGELRAAVDRPRPRRSGAPAGRADAGRRPPTAPCWRRT
jgi:hypothetical protein